LAKPTVAIIGRPNVGKSTFFNYLAGRRISIVDDKPGVTRDRIYCDVEWRGGYFSLVDTGGIDVESDEHIPMMMRRQAEVAIDLADMVLLMVDVKAGLTAADEEVADILRRSRKPVIVVVNKVDQIGQPPPAYLEFYGLGFPEVICVSSIHGNAMGDLLDLIHYGLPAQGEEPENSAVKIAVVGKPNVGKSSLINRVIEEERLIVSEAPGTTRDAVDVRVMHKGTEYVFIDTAGIRRQSKVREDIERYSVMRSWSAIERADIALFMVDAEEGVTEQDTKIAGHAHNEGKASILAVNKWDLIKKETGTLEEYRKTVHEALGFMTYAPVLFMSAKTGQRVERVFELAEYVRSQSVMRISTGTLNGFLGEMVTQVQPPADRGRRLKVYYMTQTGVKPPTFVLFVNDKELMHYSYLRYLENGLRKSFGFEGTPIRLILKEKDRD